MLFLPRFSAHRLFGIFVAVTIGCAAAEAHAQFPGGGGGMPGRGGMGGGPGSGGGQRGALGPKEMPLPPRRDALEEVHDRLDMLQEDLRLRAHQEAAWIAYAEKVRAIAGDSARERVRLRESTPVLVQLERMVDSSRNRFTAVEQVATAAKDLFAVLTAEQRTVADPRLANIVAALVRPAAEELPRAPERTGPPRR